MEYEKCKKEKRGEISFVSLFWCAIKDSNLHGLPPEPKSGASANSANCAYYGKIQRKLRIKKNGAEDEIRTRDPRLGKAMLYP